MINPDICLKASLWFRVSPLTAINRCVWSERRGGPQRRRARKRKEGNKWKEIYGCCGRKKRLAVTLWVMPFSTCNIWHTHIHVLTSFRHMCYLLCFVLTVLFVTVFLLNMYIKVEAQHHGWELPAPSSSAVCTKGPIDHLSTAPTDTHIQCNSKRRRRHQGEWGSCGQMSKQCPASSD